MRQVPPGDWAISALQLPLYEPLTLSQARQQLGIDDSQTDFDTLISSYISAARNYIEETYNLRLLKQRVRLTLSQFPYEDRIRIPIWPVQSVDAMTFVTADAEVHDMIVATSETLTPSTANYAVLTRLSRKPAELILPFARIWPPVILQMSEAVRIDMTVGYITGQSPELLLLPGAVYGAMALLIGHFFENREGSTVIGRPSEELVFGIREMLANVRLY